MTRRLSYRDYWVTMVDAFDVHVPHRELVVTATSVVETGQPRQPDTEATWPELLAPKVVDRYAQFLSGNGAAVDKQGARGHRRSLTV